MKWTLHAGQSLEFWNQFWLLLEPQDLTSACLCTVIAWHFVNSCANVLGLCADRDVRRQGQLVGGTNRKRMVTYHVEPGAKDEQLSVGLIICLSKWSSYAQILPEWQVAHFARAGKRWGCLPATYENKLLAVAELLVLVILNSVCPRDHLEAQGRQCWLCHIR